MSNDKELVIQRNDQSTPEVRLNTEDIKNYIAPNASDKELYLFMNIAQSYGLNPFKREIHFAKYGNHPGQIIVGYETYIKRAERTGLLEGWSVWCDKDNIGEKAVIEIHRKDRKHPFRWEAYRKEFDKQQSTWKAMPYFMLKKVAISQGFRLAFPEEIGGMPYTPDEISKDQTSESLPKEEVQDAQYQEVGDDTQDRPTKDQFAKMGALANELFEDKQERLDSLNAWLTNQGHEQVTSASQLTKEQATGFIQELESMKEVKDQEQKEVEENATANK